MKGFDSQGAVFMGARRDLPNCRVAIFSVPYDGTTSFRPGTRFGPAAIREVSSGLESYCPQLDLDLEDIAYVDVGSVQIPFRDPSLVVQAVKCATRKLLRHNLKPLMLGGEHSISTGAVAAVYEYYPNLVLLQLDAHADLRENWLGERHNHACTMRRCLEVIPNGQLVQLAIRSGTREEFQELVQSGRLVHHSPADSPQLLAEQLRTTLAPLIHLPLYLTVDLDWFDPAVLPGTGTPEPGGFHWPDFAAVASVLRQHHLVAADVVELAPQLDITGISSVLSAKVCRSLLLLLGQ
ncbi:agmatinase [cyanobiont of Ornithocercus magnificus]|nr:agmatinase [cyanobiont of Ornithocercus magnificus]